MDISFPFRDMNPNMTFLNEIFNLNYQLLEEISDINLSKYCIALAQYNVYLKYQINLTKSKVLTKKRFLDSVVFEILTDDIVKKYKTKTDAKEYVITSTPDLMKIREELDILDKELILVEGMDKYINEFINAFKRELSRRELELQAVRMERR